MSDTNIITDNAENLNPDVKNSKNEGLQDVGEFLMGNRKENPNLTWEDLEGMNELLRAKNTTKAKIYSRPTMEGLKNEGFTEFQAGIILNIYNKINAKPASGYTSKDDLKQRVQSGELIYVHNYERQDGTKVSGYYRSKPSR